MILYTTRTTRWWWKLSQNINYFPICFSTGCWSPCESDLSAWSSSPSCMGRERPTHADQTTSRAAQTNTLLQLGTKRSHHLQQLYTGQLSFLSQPKSYIIVKSAVELRLWGPAIVETRVGASGTSRAVRSLPPATPYVHTKTIRGHFIVVSIHDEPPRCGFVPPGSMHVASGT